MFFKFLIQKFWNLEFSGTNISTTAFSTASNYLLPSNDLNYKLNKSLTDLGLQPWVSLTLENLKTRKFFTNNSSTPSCKMPLMVGGPLKSVESTEGERRRKLVLCTLQKWMNLLLTEGVRVPIMLHFHTNNYMEELFPNQLRELFPKTQSLLLPF